MKDPVILPSSRITVDRPVIERHLLSDNTDPFNRSHLTSDMLMIPDIELKAKIEEFIRSQQLKKHGELIFFIIYIYIYMILGKLIFLIFFFQAKILQSKFG